MSDVQKVEDAINQTVDQLVAMDEEAFNEEYTLMDIDQMIETGAYIGGTFAIELARAGYLIKRESERYPFTVKSTTLTDGDVHEEIYTVNEDTLDIIAKKSFATPQLFAENYVVLRKVTEEDEDQ
jgi:hypothetical protein